MKSKILFILFILTIASCKEDVSDVSTPCDSLEDGVYIYPTLEDTTYTRHEVDSMYSIPSPILDCITTKGLVESCITHPFFVSYVFLGSTPRGSYLTLKYNINGIEELEGREDATSALLDKYISMSPDDVPLNKEEDWYSFFFYSYELLFSQKLFLDVLTLEERVMLTTECLEKASLKEDYIEYFTISIEGSSLIINTLMLIDEYPEHARFYNPNYTNPDSVMKYADDYLNFIKDKSNED